MISSLSRFDYEQWSECNLEFQKLQIYQRFAGSRQEVFILKIQNDENNAAQQDNGRCSYISIFNVLGALW